MNVIRMTVIGGIVMSAVACGTGHEDAGSSAVEPPTGGPWRVVELATGTLHAGQPIVVTFGEGVLVGTDGCNRFRLGYALEGDALRIEPDGAATLMACPGALEDQARAWRAALDATRRVSRAGARVELLDGQGARLAVLERQPLDLAGSSWEVTAYNTGREAVAGVPAGVTLTLTFADGRMAGSAGCNRFTGSYTQEGTRLTPGSIATTRRMCAEPDGVMQVEQAFVAALEAVRRVDLEGDIVRLRDGEGALQVQARRGQVGADAGIEAAGEAEE